MSLAIHSPACKRDCPDCLCLTCKHDDPMCCGIPYPTQKICPGKERCEGYEREQERSVML